MPGLVNNFTRGLPLTWPRGAIDWRALGRAYPDHLRVSGEAELARLAGRVVYVASPISYYLEIGQTDIVINHALEHVALLLCRRASPISPVLHHLMAQVMRPEDEIAAVLDAMPRAWWLGRCEPLLAASTVMAITPCPGWSDSAGVWAEANWMLERQRTVLMPGSAPACEPGVAP